MKWLVTGAAGYIGSHVVVSLLNSNQDVIGLDSLITGKAARLDGICELINTDIRNMEDIDILLKSKKIEGIINLAALKSVDESRRIPNEYDQVNHLGAMNLMKLAVKNDVTIFLQSSTAAVYGESKDGFVSESSELAPISPYGKSKVQAEHFLNSLLREDKIKGISFRYFNVVGSLTELLKDNSKSNLFPKVMHAIELGEPPVIFGDDYPTEDGTCIRDYVHVEDVARAHVLAATKLRESQTSFAINLGTGTGFSVRDIINEIIEQKESSLLPIVLERRIGDPAILVARVELAKNELGFITEKNLQEMVSSSI